MTTTSKAGHRSRTSRRLAAAAAGTAVLSATLAGPALAAPAPVARPVARPAAPAARPALPGATGGHAVVVQAGSVAVARAAVLAAGGTVTRELPVVGGVAARLPVGGDAAVRAAAGVRAVTPDTALSATTYRDDLGYDPATTFGSLHQIAALTGAQSAYAQGITGKGVDVALIDSGVAPVKGLTSGNVVNGPDLSLDAGIDPTLAGNDAFGHGTHMASIILGRDQVSEAPAGYTDDSRFTGMAPDARLVNVKVASSTGATDVSQVLAGINWVIEHRRDGGLNIRVINLSYGTDSTQGYESDPLAFAVEQAWKAGIVVVASGGNDGNDRNYLGMPAQDPTVLAVGAEDPNGTASRSDDTVPSWASKGDVGNNSRHVDLVAPGTHVLGLTSPGGTIDSEHPDARTGSRFIRGNGTSQATAVVSGAVALYLQKFPAATPDQVKRALVQSAQPLPGVPNVYQGSGGLDVARALRAPLPQGGGTARPANGLGSLELSRGTDHVFDCADADCTTVVPLTGEKDLFGPYDAAAWTSRTAAGTTWADNAWMDRGFPSTGWSGMSWAGMSWNGMSWNGRSWSGMSWNGRSWSGMSWNGMSWNGTSWNGRSWSGMSWNGMSWNGRSWSGMSWNGRSWSGRSWSGVSWG